MMKFTIRLVFILFLSLNLFGKTKLIGKYEKFVVRNHKRGIVYYKIDPGKNIKIKLPYYSEIYVRALIPNKNVKSYYFKIISKRMKKTYKRKIKKTNRLIGENGESISTLSKITPKQSYIKFVNISDFPLIIRVREKYKNVVFLPYPPEQYGKIVQIKLKEKIYPYYLKDEFSFDVSGKVILKIMSRLINPKNKDTYSYLVYDNGKLLEKTDIQTKKSDTALANGNTVSKASVRYFELKKGSHHIKIKAQTNVIFKFYVDKNSVRLIK